ncbi:similar to Saccharomyces cerevisiae YGR268C HUA1 Cytoplasmic protein containing a zinc finger domain with sequence similarity to that of Type I J-proteins [Maudiozyma saulgeensis]|uniref:Similar to Saccharomyces cerevisiae YGR268C HUA1 Cytoplasmic protein containing a zinc finger domain with sequence similarity to that of Type I J-proteins n=1 Tax=Maudiozyma saulgeensis TaxID=1789683 RepID=A0A1X7R9T1_9SACH|nr:similar to Saccharomyces cerevisiae YGR268C HUA1 Cytoplasmic protein containing a zinc finger domain with sequence similarity to that of Type I J-proteins [Kazachstania saulgeensis]
MPKQKFNDTESMPPDDELPSYEDVINSETQQQQQQQQQSHSTPQLNNNYRPPAPPRPPRPTNNNNSLHNHHSTGPRIPWVYPSGFYCPKCNNTGYKIKNGKSCKSCWRRFARQNNVNMAPSGYGNYYQSSPIYQQPMYQQPQQTQRPLYVRPGDPRIGGVLCGNCRGSGRIRFLLDEDICRVCNGLGRIIG